MPLWRNKVNRRFRILVVDDEPFNIKLLTAALKEEYDIFTALGGHDAISIVKKQTPDLILLDVMMPDLSGFEVCSILKSDAAFADIPVIFLTAFDTLDGEIRGLELGAIDYLTKPVNIDLLRLQVRNHIELKERNDLVREQRDLLAHQKEELEAALARVKRLEGIIPICMYCKSIRTDKDSWQRLEAYITENTDAQLSHGMCPECFEKEYENITGVKL
jgi:DNA-binding response OmpR family regulator